MTEEKKARLAFNYYGNCVSLISTKESCKTVFEEIKLQAENTLDKFKEQFTRDELLKDLRAKLIQIAKGYEGQKEKEMKQEDKLIFMSAMMSLMLLNGLDNTQECGIVMYEEGDTPPNHNPSSHTPTLQQINE